MELLSLAVLIDSLVFMSKVEGSISSISGGGLGLLPWYDSFRRLSRVLSLLPYPSFYSKTALFVSSTGTSQHLPILK